MGPGVLSRSSSRQFSPTAQELLACTCLETEWSTKWKTGRCRELGYTIAIASKRLDVAGLSSVSKFSIIPSIGIFSKIPNVVVNSIVTRVSFFYRKGGVIRFQIGVFGEKTPTPSVTCIYII